MLERRRRAEGAAALSAALLLPQCGEAPTSASRPLIPCSATPDSAFYIPGLPTPAPSQETACAGSARPRIENVKTLPRDGGLQVDYDTIAPDGGNVCAFVYLNKPAGGGCGISGSVFDNTVSFPVSVRIVAWDSRGCLAEPVCLTVP